MPRGRPLEIDRELLEAFLHGGRVNEYLVSVVPDAIWHAPPPGGGRSIAAIVAHMQSLRRTFARMGGAQPGPPSLDGKRCTRADAERALRESTRILAAQFEGAIAAGLARVKGQPRRVVDMLTYILQHDAHHRGQITMRARELGSPLRGEDVTRIFGWKKLDAPAADAAARPRRRVGARERS